MAVSGLLPGSPLRPMGHHQHAQLALGLPPSDSANTPPGGQASTSMAASSRREYAQRDSMHTSTGTVCALATPVCDAVCTPMHAGVKGPQYRFNPETTPKEVFERFFGTRNPYEALEGETMPCDCITMITGPPCMPSLV